MQHLKWIIKVIHEFKTKNFFDPLKILTVFQKCTYTNPTVS